MCVQCVSERAVRALREKEWQTAVERATHDMIDRLAADTPAAALR